jgi:hypothetical protein
MVGCRPALRQSFFPAPGDQDHYNDEKLVIFQRVSGFTSILGTGTREDTASNFCQRARSSVG